MNDKKGIYLKPVSVDDLKERVLNYINEDQDLKFATDMLALAKSEVKGTFEEKTKIRTAKTFQGALDIGITLSFYHMGGSESKTIEKTKIG